MKSKIVVLFVLFVCSSFARPFIFNIHKELKDAERIVQGTILKYDRGLLSFKNDSTGLIESTNVSGGMLRNPARETDSLAVKENYLSILSGRFPTVGEQVLIVINDENDVRLFAYKKDGYYRFWTPKISNSVSHFAFESPVLPIFPNYSFYNPRQGLCVDGCLYPIDQLELRQ